MRGELPLMPTRPVSWLSGSIAGPSSHIHKVGLSWQNAVRSQWRYRSGFAPLSLNTPMNERRASLFNYPMLNPTVAEKNRQSMSTQQTSLLISATTFGYLQ